LLAGLYYYYYGRDRGHGQDLEAKKRADTDHLKAKGRELQEAGTTRAHDALKDSENKVANVRVRPACGTVSFSFIDRIYPIPGVG
jgi:hypothetical protein